MTRLLCGNVVSAAYFEDPSALPDRLHRIGDALGARMLWLARPGDTILLGSAPSPSFLRAAEQVLEVLPVVVTASRRGRRTVPEAALADPAVIRRLRALRPRSVLPYAWSPDVVRLADALGADLDGPSRGFVAAGQVRAANDKTRLRAVAHGLGVPLPLGEARPGGARRDPGWRRGGPLIVKERLSGGGLGNRLVRAGAPLGAVPARPFVVERFEDFRAWPSADFVIGGDGAVHDRQLSLMRVAGDTNAYDGVTIPADESPDALAALLDAGRALGRWWAARGFRGWFDVDGGITREGRFLLTEMNARCTGGTPIDAIARRLVGERYADRATLLAREHLPLRREPSAVIDAAVAEGLVATPRSRSGVVPLWEGRRPPSLGYAVLAETRADAVAMEERFAALSEPIAVDLATT